MSGPWKLLTLQEGRKPVLVNTALFETVREHKDYGSWLYPKHSVQGVYLAVTEPFELVVAMLTEQPDGDAQKDIAYLLEAYKNGQFADDMLDHPSPDCRSPSKPVREALWRHLDRLARE